MSLLRSARFPAVILLVAAGLGLFVANSALAPAVDAAMHAEFGIPGVFELSLSHWIKDGLLAVFFFVVAVELQFELTSGQLNSARKALQPAIAAAGGVLVPIAIYAAMAWGSDATAGWPIPTATDIAFALGVLAVFGKGLPAALRVFLLALAILDDIVGIIFIAVLFTDGVNIAALAGAAVAVVAFGILSRQLDTRGRVPIAVLLVLLAITAWVLVYMSGVHATIAGVVLGLAMAQQPALRVRHELEPWVNVIVLPVFAFSAALVAIPSVPLSQTLAGVLGGAGGAAGRQGRRYRGVRLAVAAPRAPGECAAAGVRRPRRRRSAGRHRVHRVAALSELAFSDAADLRDQATLGVLAGSVISLVLAAGLVSWRAWHYRQRETTASATT